MPPRRLFAIIPAAGHSRRMGRAKLLLPLGSGTVIGRLLSVLKRPEISDTLVVLRAADEPLRAAVVAGGARPIQPEVDPPDMRQSVAAALTDLAHTDRPEDDDGWLLVPADHPLLDPRVMDQLLARWQDEACRMLVPTHAGRRGHPTLFRWSFAREVAGLPANAGLNRLLQQHAACITELPVDSPSVITDLDTPEDYERLLQIDRQSNRVLPED